MTLREAIHKYIASSDAVLSETTIAGYQKIQEVVFHDIMDVPLQKLTTATLAEAVNAESKRFNGKSKKKNKIISPKTVCNEYGFVTAVLNWYRPKFDRTVKLSQKEVIDKEVLPPEIKMEVIQGTEIELAALPAV